MYNRCFQQANLLPYSSFISKPFIVDFSNTPAWHVNNVYIKTCMITETYNISVPKNREMFFYHKMLARYKKNQDNDKEKICLDKMDKNSTIKTIPIEVAEQDN